MTTDVRMTREYYSLELLRGSADRMNEEDGLAINRVIELQDQRFAYAQLGAAMVAMNRFSDASANIEVTPIPDEIRGELIDQLKGLVQSCDRLDKEDVFIKPTEDAWTNTRSLINGFMDLVKWSAASKTDLTSMQLTLTQMRDFAAVNMNFDEKIGVLEAEVDQFNLNLNAFIKSGPISTDSQVALQNHMMESRADIEAKVSDIIHKLGPIPGCEMSKMMLPFIDKSPWEKGVYAISGGVYYYENDLASLQESHKSLYMWLTGRLKELDMSDLLDSAISEVAGSYADYSYMNADY